MIIAQKKYERMNKSLLRQDMEVLVLKTIKLLHHASGRELHITHHLVEEALPYKGDPTMTNRNTT